MDSICDALGDESVRNRDRYPLCERAERIKKSLQRRKKEQSTVDEEKAAAALEKLDSVNPISLREWSTVRFNVIQGA